LQKQNPEKFISSEVSKTSETAKTTTSLPKPSAKPATKKPKQASEQVQTKFKMMLLEGDIILDDACTFEEKPLIITGRDPSTYAYQLKQTITNPQQTKVITEQHVPIPSNVPGTASAEHIRRSSLIISEEENQPQSALPSTGEKSIIPYKGKSNTSQAKIIKWSFTHNSRYMFFEREDGTCKALTHKEELLNLSTEDLLTLQQLEPEHGPLLTKAQIKDVKTLMLKEIKNILDSRKKRGSK